MAKVLKRGEGEVGGGRKRRRRKNSVIDTSMACGTLRVVDDLRGEWGWLALHVLHNGVQRANHPRRGGERSLDDNYKTILQILTTSTTVSSDAPNSTEEVWLASVSLVVSWLSPLDNVTFEGKESACGVGGKRDACSLSMRFFGNRDGGTRKICGIVRVQLRKRGRPSTKRMGLVKDKKMGRGDAV